MQKSQASLLTRSDTMFGVCQAIGEDFGFNPNWLRVAFALIVVFNVGLALGAYGAAALLVLVSRLVFPTRRKAVAPQTATEATVSAKDESVPETAKTDAAQNDGDLLLAAAA